MGPAYTLACICAAAMAAGCTGFYDEGIPVREGDPPAPARSAMPPTLVSLTTFAENRDADWQDELIVLVEFKGRDGKLTSCVCNLSFSYGSAYQEIWQPFFNATIRPSEFSDYEVTTFGEKRATWAWSGQIDNSRFERQCENGTGRDVLLVAQIFSREESLGALGDLYCS